MDQHTITPGTTTLNHAQMAWLSSVADSPVKRYIKYYFESLDKSGIELPKSYKDHINFMKIVDESGPEHFTNTLMHYSARGAFAKFYNKQSWHKILLELIPADTKWDPSEVNEGIKSTISQMMFAARFAFGLFARIPEYKDLFETLTLEIDQKNLTLYFKDSKFPEQTLDMRIGLKVEPF